MAIRRCVHDDIENAQLMLAKLIKRVIGSSFVIEYLAVSRNFLIIIQRCRELFISRATRKRKYACVCYSGILRGESR
jgi:hypothetical protein